MKRFFVASVVLAGALVGMKANAYNAMTPGDIVVYRVGDGSAVITGLTASVAVFLDEYTPAGALVQSIPMPTAASGPNDPLTAAGASTAEGLITLESDGLNILVPGYGAAPGVAGVASTASTVVPRVVGVVDVSAANGIDTSTQINNAGSGDFRSAASDNGNNIWVTTSTVGLLYTTFGTAGPATANIAGGNSGPTNMRQVNIINGQLMVGDQSGSAFRLATVGTGLPTTTGQLMANLPGTSGSNPTSTYAFVQLHLAGGPAGNNTMYVADDSGSIGTTNAGLVSQIEKWSLVGGTWVQTGSIAAPVARGVAAQVDGSGNVDVFFTDGNAQSIVPFAAGNISNLNLAVDSSGYDGTFSGTSTVIANVGGATGTESFRGIVIVPVPEPSTIALVGAGVLGMVAMRRRRRS